MMTMICIPPPPLGAWCALAVVAAGAVALWLSMRDLLAVGRRARRPADTP